MLGTGYIRRNTVGDGIIISTVYAPSITGDYETVTWKEGNFNSTYQVLDVTDDLEDAIENHEFYVERYKDYVRHRTGGSESIIKRLFKLLGW